MSASHEPAAAAMRSGVQLEVICAACPWDRLCVEPPTMTPDQVQEKVDGGFARDDQVAQQGRRAPLPVHGIMAALAVGHLASHGAVCPVFAARLRTDRGVADSVRQTMRGYVDAE